MNKWVNAVTFVLIGILIMAGIRYFGDQFEWVRGTISLPNRELAFANTAIEVTCEDVVTNKAYKQLYTMKRGDNLIHFAVLVPKTIKDFRLSYRLDKNKPVSLMRFAYYERGGLDSYLNSVLIDQAEPLPLAAVKNKMLHVQLLENTPVWDHSERLEASLLSQSKADWAKAEDLILYVDEYIAVEKALWLRWLLIQADIESELLWLTEDTSGEGQGHQGTKPSEPVIINSLLLDGVYYFVDMAKTLPQMMDLETFEGVYPLDQFTNEHGFF